MFFEKNTVGIKHLNTSISFLKRLNDLIFEWSLSLKAWGVEK